MNKTQTVNFLGKTYQKKMTQPVIKPSQIKTNQQQIINPINKFINVDAYQKPSIVEKSSYEASSYGPMYIDNFAGYDVNSRLQINDFIGNNFQRRP